MISRHVIYCDHYHDGAGEAGSNARKRKPATVSHEINIWLNTQVLLYMSRFACLLGDRDNTGHLIGHVGKCFLNSCKFW